MKRFLAWPAAAVLAVALAACGQDVQGASPGGATPPAATTPTGVTMTTDDPVEDLTVPPSARPGAQEGRETTVTGVLEAGVEANCLLVGEYLVVGDTAGLAAGDRVTVTGRVDRSLMTTCQQGTPLMVTSISPA